MREPTSPRLLKAATSIGLVFLLTISDISCQRHLPKDDWSNFASSLLEAARSEKASVLVHDLSFMDMQYLQQAARRVGYPAPKREEVVKATEDAVAIFLRSYDDLFDGELTCVASREIILTGIEDPELKAMEPREAIIWVRKGDRYKGIRIHAVAQTQAGLKVLDWLGDRGNPTLPGATLWKKRAHLEATENSCDYPSQIEYEYQFRSP